MYSLASATVHSTNGSPVLAACSSNASLTECATLAGPEPYKIPKVIALAA